MEVAVRRAAACVSVKWSSKLPEIRWEVGTPREVAHHTGERSSLIGVCGVCNLCVPAWLGSPECGFLHSFSVS